MTTPTRTVTARSPEPGVSHRPRVGPRAGLVVDLTAGLPLSAEQERNLVSDAQAGATAGALLNLGLLRGAQVNDAHRRVTTGERARATLVKSYLDRIYQIASHSSRVKLTSEVFAAALEAFLDSVARFDVAADTPFAVWVPEHMAHALVPCVDPAAVRPQGPQPQLVMAGRAGPGPAAAGEVLLTQIRAVLVGAELTPAELDVLRMRFGMDGSRPHSLTETGKSLGWTREQVRATEARVLARLRRHPSATTRQADSRQRRHPLRDPARVDPPGLAPALDRAPSRA